MKGWMAAEDGERLNRGGGPRVVGGGRAASSLEYAGAE